MKRCSKCKRKVEHVTKRRGFQLCDTCLREVNGPGPGYQPLTLGDVLGMVLNMPTSVSQSERDVMKGRKR